MLISVVDYLVSLNVIVFLAELSFLLVYWFLGGIFAYALYTLCCVVLCCVVRFLDNCMGSFFSVCKHLSNSFLFLRKPFLAQ